MSAPKESGKKPAAKKTPTPKKAAPKAAASKAASAGKKMRSTAGKTGKGRGRPSSSDLLGLLVLGLTASLAACAGGGLFGGGKTDTGTTDTAKTPTGQVTIRFLDVGQGDAVLIRSPEGKTLLYDGGRSAERMREHMETYGITKIDLMIASHGDADHIAGLVPAAEAKPTLFINNGIPATTQTWKRLVDALEASGTKFQKANDQVINLGSVKVRVIDPPAGMGKDQNENSVGIRLDFGNFHALMTGDSEKPETEAWLEEDRPEIKGPFQLYKSIHHGAANGDHPAWLAQVRPENVVIGVGDNNYGHPTKTALDLYKQNGIRIYRTDQNGTVTFTGNSDGTYTVTTDR
ncbi:ComEC/Rec2 family competence protein [Deinococcus puniceus]|uniref:Competence protein ComEC n=1 Tax=Deinococcus puniceus TaxID=1182568 RepID=A0A172TC29_9DEIO|nr:ComEC/Rec2 family competence protein [Deinococcus puniceus]ANE44615.1 competence protein ComEC [Deinococcus puniceus]